VDAVNAIWLASPVALLLGAVAVAILAVRVGRATDELSDARRRSRRLEDALIPVRVETRRARSSIDRLRRK